jgi:Flp pilus assembly protein TadG
VQRGKTQCRGAAILEFVLVGVPLLLFSTGVMVLGLDMWEYYTLAWGTQSTARYVVMHGRSCLQGDSSCLLTVANVCTYFASHSLALDPSQTKLVLNSATATVSCNPVTSCSSNNAQFPSSTDNGVNFDVSVSAYYTIVNPIALIVPFSPSGPLRFTLYATSRQRIVY